MRRAVAAIPALAVTLALFFLMQMLIAPSSRDIPKPILEGGVGLVTLVRDSDSGSAPGETRNPLPPLPAPAAEPPSETAAAAQIPTPPAPELTADIPAPEAPVLDALPFLGGPPVTTQNRPTPTPKPKLATKKSRKHTANATKSSKGKSYDKELTKGSRSAQAKAGSKGRGRSTGISAGKKESGRGRGEKGKRSAGGGGKGDNNSGDRGVVVVSRPKPDYPRKALQNREEGWVKVSFTITEKGTVTDPRVVAAKPRRVFDRSALQAIRKWRFKPKTVGGKPVRTKATQLIEFNLARR